MSVNITIDTTIQVPLEVAAAMQAAADTTGDFENVSGTEGVKDSMNTALVRAFKALPYRIQPQPEPAANSDPPPSAQEASHYRSRQTVVPGSRNRSRSPGSRTSSATSTSFDIHVRGIFKNFIVYAEPTTTIGQLKEMIQSEDGLFSRSRALFYDAKTICFAVDSVRKRNMTLQALGLRGGETIDLVPQASAQWDGSFEWEDGAIEWMEELEREAIQAEMDAAAAMNDSDDDTPYESEDEFTARLRERQAMRQRQRMMIPPRRTQA